MKTFQTCSKFVQWHYRDNSGCLQTATGLILSENGDRVTVKIVRDGVETDDTATIMRAHVQIDQAALGGDRAVKENFRLGQPTEEQLKRINQYLPNGVDKLAADQVVTVPFIAADNLINRSYDKWDIDSLAVMAKLLPGLPAMLNHDWHDTTKTWGTIYNATLVQSRSAPAIALNRAGNFDSNRQIVAKEGFAQVLFEAFAPVDSPVVQALRMGHPGGISTGGFRFKDYVCPLCNVSFNDEENCPHLIPDSWWRIPGSHKDIAPYAIRVGLFDMGEASIVAIPNLPNAGVI